MIKVIVKNLDGVVTNQASHDDQQKAEQWVDSCEKIKAFGKPERWIHEDDLSAMGEDKTLAIASEEVGSMEEDRKRYKFAAEYTVVYEDITNQIIAEADKAQALKHLADTDWYVLRKVETGLGIPDSILASRAAARVVIGH